ncbi:MAG: sigma-70 family RNA polymerase sigma factor [bacterium]|nr:sigma-70 family RNA polymerase sigma factor [Gemmatimonadota bacterium]
MSFHSDPRGEGPAPPTGETTAYLLDRAQGGDDRALNRLCERLRPRLHRWASGRLPAGARGLTDTEDLVQDALVQTIKRLESFRPEHRGSFFAYLRQAVMNRIRDQIRRRDVGERVMDAVDEPRDPFHSPLEEVVGREMVDRYETALLRLSDSDREAIIARVELDLDYGDIAGMIGSASAHAARMKVSRALVKLAKEMDHGS